MKNLASKVSLVILSIFITLLFLEGLLRILGIGFVRGIPPRWYFVATYYGYDINPNFYPPVELSLEGEGYKYSVWSNSLGCFDIEHNLNNSSSKVLLLGDSFTWGYTSFEKKFGTIFEKLTGVETLKCGVTGYGVKQAIEKATNIFKQVKGIDTVIYAYYLNDVDDDFLYPSRTVVRGFLVRKWFYSDIKKGSKICYSYDKLEEEAENYTRFCTRERPKREFFQSLKCFLSRHSYLYNLVKVRLKQVLPSNILKVVQIKTSKHTMIYPFAIFGLDKFNWVKSVLHKEINLLNELKQKRDLRILVLIFPLKEQVYPYLLKCSKYVQATFAYRELYYDFCLKGNKIDYNCLYKPQEILKEELKAFEIPFIDFLPIFQFYANKNERCFLNEKDLYWKFDGHFNERGNILVGLILSKVAIKYDLVKVTNKDKKLEQIDALLTQKFGKAIPDKILDRAVYIPKEIKSKTNIVNASLLTNKRLITLPFKRFCQFLQP